MTSLIGFFATDLNFQDHLIDAQQRVRMGYWDQVGGQWILSYSASKDSGANGDSDKGHAIEDCRGVFWGRLFDCEQFIKRDEQRISAQLANQIINSKGRALSSMAWGRYAGIIVNDGGDELYLFRDPSGFQHFYYAVVDTGIWFGSDASEVIAAADLPFEIDWGFAAPFLVNRGLNPSSRTGILRLEELLPGEMLTLKNQEIQRTKFWDLGDVAENRDRSHEELSYELQLILERAFKSWATDSGRVALLFSGGLDSSCVLAALVGAIGREAITAIHYYTEDQQIDERYYARLAASHLGVELIELKVPDTDVGMMLPTYRTARPHSRSVISTFDEKIVTAATERGCVQIWNGVGGDSIFLSDQSASQLIDLLWSSGLRASLKKAIELSAYHGSPLLGTLSSAVALVLRTLITQAQLSNSRVRAPAFYTEKLLAHHRESLRNKSRLMSRTQVRSLAKSDHILGIMNDAWEAAEQSSAPSVRSFESISPLLSQPILEWAASVPAYQFLNDFQDRSILRTAFAKYLPESVVTRKNKGAYSAPRARGFRRNANRIQSIITNGALGQNSMVSKEYIHAQLNADETKDNEISANLTSAVAFEIWVNSWNQQK